MIFTGKKESVYIRKEFNFFETDTGRPFRCSGTPIGNLSKDDENVKTSAYFGHFRNEKRTGVELHASRNCIWDRYWGHASQLLANRVGYL